VNVDILIVDKQGTPRDWADVQTAACYYAKQKVIWEIGSHVKTFVGGKDKNGETSEIAVSSILGVSGPIFGSEFYNRETMFADRPVLYSRDRHMCAYCGTIFKDYQLTIDHVHPKSRGGKNTWVNSVSACKRCNCAKADRTPEEAGMQLLYVPYAPNLFEKMILKNRKILQDQMDFLITRVPKHSRLHTH
jgi:5-methylcytosine-specific restriction endonuclease McrA